LSDDVTQLPEGEGQAAPQEPVIAPEPQPEPPSEPYQIKYRGEVQNVPRDYIDGIAEHLNTSPEGVLNAFQRAKEADRISRENIAYKQQLAEFQAQAAMYQERMGGGQAPPIRQAQPYAPQYPPPQYAPAPPQYQPPPQGADEDAFVYLRRLDQGLQMTQRQVQEFMQWQQDHQQRLEEQQQQVYKQQQAQEISSQLSSFLAEKNKGRREPIDIEDFSAEVSLMGGASPYMPLHQAAERAWTWMTREEREQQARSETLDRLQNRRAVVTVPGRSGATPAPPAAPSMPVVTLGQIIENLPMK